MNLGFAQVKTLEQALIDREKLTHIIVDEASALSVLELIALCNVPNMHVRLYGDEGQVGVIGMSRIIGERSNQNALNYYDFEEWTHSLRYGQPYVDDVLSHLYEHITCDKNIKTDYKHMNCNTYDEVVSYSISNKLDAVYCFYDEHYHALNDKFLNSSISHGVEVRKVYANQGSDADRVGVLYWRSGNSTSEKSILHNEKFLRTALTRLKYHMTWFTQDATNISPMQAIEYTVTGSATKEDFQFLNLDDLSLRREINLTEQQLITVAIETVCEGSKVECTSTQIAIYNLHEAKGVNIFVTQNGIHTGSALTDFMVNSYRKTIRGIFNRKLRKYIDLTSAESASEVSEQIPVINAIHSRQSNSRQSVGNSHSTQHSVYHDCVDHSIDNVELIEVTEENAKIESLNSYNMKEVEVTLIVNDLLNSNKHDLMIKNLEIRTVAMCSTMWMSLIQLIDVSLNSRVFNHDLILEYSSHKIRILSFNGCSLQAGLRFTFEDGDVVYISSAHAKGKDTILSMMATPVRCMVGRTEKLDVVTNMLVDDAELLYLGKSFTYLLRRINERVCNLLNMGAIKCVGGKIDPGTQFFNQNKVKFESWNLYNEPIELNQTWQPTNYVIIARGKKSFMMPGMKRVKTINDILLYSDGINGDETTEMSITNQLLADRLLTRKILATGTESLTVFVPEQCINMQSLFIESALNTRNVIRIAGPCLDDTVAGLLNAVVIMFAYKVMRIKQVDLFNIDAITVSLQNRVDYRMNARSLSTLECKHIESVNNAKLTAMLEDINKTVDGPDKINKQIAYESCYNNAPFIRDGKRSDVCIVGYPSKLTDEHLTYNQLIYVVPELLTKQEIETETGIYLRGTDMKLRQTTNTSYTVLYRVGGYAVCLVKPHHTNVLSVMSLYDISKVRTFVVSGEVDALVKIPNFMYKKLISRAYAEEVALMDLLAYARAQLSNLLYTTSGPKGDTSI